jgi:hypothetical protein
VEQDVQTDALYDFLYRDSNRIGSLYAQIFGGKLSSFEQSKSEREATDKSAKLGVSGSGFEGKLTSDSQSSLKKSFDATDILAGDVLGILTKDDRFRKDVRDAPHGSLILANGTLVFVDKGMVEMSSLIFDMLIGAEQRKSKKERNEESIQSLTIIKRFMTSVTIPSAFLLRTAEGYDIVGTIKDSGMEEPISTYYFKHGVAGLADVYLVGIKEVPSPAFSIPDNQLFGAGQKAAEALSNMLFPKEALRVTPVALFRKL